jgi:hypothetical protein
MRARLLPVAALAAALLAGCGDRNLVVNVDVLSYLDPAATRLAFGPVPAVPGGLYTGEQPVVQDVEVNLFERPSDVAKVHTVALSFGAEVADSTGSGNDTLRIYLSTPEADPLTTTPVVTIPLALAPAHTDTVRVNVTGDARLVEIFNGTRARLTMTTALRGPASGEALNGRLRITEIRAIVIANRKGL